jgi:hypothetical protein
VSPRFAAAATVEGAAPSCGLSKLPWSARDTLTLTLTQAFETIQMPLLNPDTNPDFAHFLRQLHCPQNSDIPPHRP